MSETGASLKFNFHNQVAAEIFASQPEDAEFFNSEYEHHRVAELDASIPRVELSIQPWRTLEGIPPGYTQHSHKYLARWAYHLAIHLTTIKIDVFANRLAVPMVHHMLLHPSLRYLAAQNDLLMLHAGAIASRGRSLILTGHGGAGKTTTTSLLLAQGGADYLPHADDYVFLQNGPKSLAYMTRSHLYLNLLEWVPELRQSLTVPERRRLFFFGKLRAWSNENIKWPVRLPVERLWPGRPIAQEATPVGLVLLDRTATTEPRLVSLTPEDFPIDDLVRMNFREARHFLHLLAKSQAVIDFQDWQTAWRERERNLLKNRVAEIPIYSLELPRSQNSPSAYLQELTVKLMQIIEELG